MDKIDEQSFQRLVDLIVEWKMSGNVDWAFIAEHLYHLQEYAILPKAIADEVRPKLIEEAKYRIQEEQNATKGISDRTERWFHVKSLGNYTQWYYFKKMMNGWSAERMNLVSQEAEEIVNDLSNPKKPQSKPEDATRKGLVYGNVQSGKTACFSAVIAMYASAGCNLIIVLSGVTKNLRLQTQDRLRHDLGIDKYSCFDLITAQTDLLAKDTQSIEGKIKSGIKCIGVFKKSPAALNRLLAFLSAPNDPSFWKGHQVLVIDDECDQYSVDVNTIYDNEDRDYHEPDDDERSKINRGIVKILKVFERYCYVGFTATPFANLLNEPPSDTSLYPKDFIYPLQVREKYYGAMKLFGSANADPEEPLTTMKAITIVPEEEMSPIKNKFQNCPRTLQESIRYFLVATACKYFRGLTGHSSMLVHLDMKQSVHDKLKAVIEPFINTLKEEDCSHSIKFMNVWDKYKDENPFETVKALFHYDESDRKKFVTPEYEALVPYLKEVITKLDVLIDNSKQPMEERLHYSSDKSEVKIVIGGNTLSRGLTLEGLLVSYFYRTSKNYDTLLQMGRWFGYRPGYENLARLYTTQDIPEKFSSLADVEEELREQFTNYGFSVTPSDVGVTIRTLPSLQITRKKAMQSAISTGVNYAGQRAQTLYFPRTDHEWLLYNQKCTRELLDSLGVEPENKNNQLLFSNIPIDTIYDYTNKINILEDNQTCQKSLLLKFLDKARSNKVLLHWNIVIVSNLKGKPFQISSKLTVNLVQRSRFDTMIPGDNRIYLKILQQPNNMLLDTDRWASTSPSTPIAKKFRIRKEFFAQQKIQEPGLLLIYPIDKDSKPRDKEKRLPLEAAEHIIGCTFVFPTSNDKNLQESMTIKL